jgi:hypothetical protein
VLEPYVRFAGRGELVLQPEFDRLSAEHKLVCVLLSVKAQQLLGMRDTDDVAPQEIVTLTGMAAGTVRPGLAALIRARRNWSAKRGRCRGPRDSPWLTLAVKVVYC